MLLPFKATYKQKNCFYTAKNKLLNLRRKKIFLFILDIQIFHIERKYQTSHVKKSEKPRRKSPKIYMRALDGGRREEVVLSDCNLSCRKERKICKRWRLVRKRIRWLSYGAVDTLF